MMEQKRPKFRLRLNLFDAIVLVLAVLAVVFLLWWTQRGSSVEDVAQANTATVRYTIRFLRWKEGSETVIHPDDVLADNIKNYELGRILSIQPIPSTGLVVDKESRSLVRAELEGYEDILVTVESPCTVSDSAVTLGAGYELRVGVEGYYRGVGYMAYGPVIDMEIEEAAE